MSKNPFDLNSVANQAKGMKVAKAVGDATLGSAQAIAQLNQQAAQELAARIQNKVAELMKAQNPQSAFDYVHAEVLQDAAKEVIQYQAKLFQAINSGNQELAQIAQSMIQESQQDLIHFVNEATQNAPAGSEPYTSVFKTSFSNALQNFELIRAAMADSFTNFEKSVEKMNQFTGVQQGSSAKPQSGRGKKS
ncbi:phasin family protein [Polynucleobacter sp. es-EL-1]|uniref:phasin family protein n=1 Tax=Polynucleobacter sp. es-EL-1 TaxID=1855652 RepID=UPI001BFDBE83|nr:phasin family protein [Polynucleobacter sp. es-EL-1]QWE10940.1 phasin family protein [Polynucleobacter sp. es-EL-1]